MKVIEKQFALVFFLGFVFFLMAVGYGSMVGAPLSAEPILVQMRFMGGGLMLSGMALWIMLRRTEAGKPGLNPLVGLFIGSGCLLLTLRLVYPQERWTYLFDWGGLSLIAAGLALGLAIMIAMPAYPRPVTVRWPEGGEPQTDSHGGSSSTH